MNKDRIVEIIETLLDGYSPTTGESLADNVILNDREIIRAFTIAVSELKRSSSFQDEKVGGIDANDFLNAVKLLESNNLNVTENRLRKFFSGQKLNENEDLSSHTLFGKYEDQLSVKGISLSVRELYSRFVGNSNRQKPKKPWSHITFFKEDKFNLLTEYEIEGFKKSIDRLGLIKNEDLSGYVIDSRRNFKRAYEPWLEEEIIILKTVIEKTNDIQILTEIFQRGRGGIQSQVKKLIFFTKDNEDDRSEE